MAKSYGIPEYFRATAHILAGIDEGAALYHAKRRIVQISIFLMKMLKETPGLYQFYISKFKGLDRSEKSEAAAKTLIG